MITSSPNTRAKDSKEAMISVYNIKRCSGITMNVRLSVEDQDRASLQLQSVRKALEPHALSNYATFSTYLKHHTAKV